jgi:G3E family GTPase
VVQGVHMLLEGGSQRAWKSDEKRDSRLVFIGRGLPRDRLKQEFESCRV